jgi:hypothetical protein
MANIAIKYRQKPHKLRGFLSKVSKQAQSRNGSNSVPDRNLEIL